MCITIGCVDLICLRSGGLYKAANTSFLLRLQAANLHGPPSAGTRKQGLARQSRDNQPYKAITPQRNTGQTKAVCEAGTKLEIMPNSTN